MWLMQMTAPPHNLHSRKHSTKRQKVKLSIWVDAPEQTQLKQLADSHGLSLSETGRAMIVDGIRHRLRIEREVLATPILEAFFDKKMNQAINRLAEFLGRSVYELGQMRWLYVNTLYHDTLRKVATAKTAEQKEALQQAFYKLLDTSQKETVKAAKHWNPKIIDVVATIKEQLKEEPA